MSERRRRSRRRMVYAAVMLVVASALVVVGVNIGNVLMTGSAAVSAAASVVGLVAGRRFLRETQGWP